MRLSDLISQTILQMLEESHGETEIKRNELAGELGCVPSQINYVIQSRFTPEQGYIVESKRGGGGYIKITKIRLDRSSALMHIINSIGNELNTNTARILLNNLALEDLISKEAANLIGAAINDNCYQDIPPILRNKVRAAVFKQMLVSCI